MRTVVVGTRKSALALTQTGWVMDRLREANPRWELRQEKIVTKGDRILDVTLSKIGGKGLFVKEIEQALLDGRIDIAVHSMKDMPGEMPDGLVIGAVTQREDPRDCLITRSGHSLEKLPPGARIGTSSLRRQAQILAYRPDVTVEPVRGNLETRLRKMEEGQFDAILLAVAGLSRMGWQDRVTQALSTDIMVPAVGQGALAVQCRADDTEVLEGLKKINDPKTERAVRAERAFLHVFEGGCHLPVGAYAEATDGSIHLIGMVAHPDGRKVLRGAVEGAEPEQVGRILAQQLLEQGAGELLSALREEMSR
ncbi:hydroxymethylbilane synthase [Polycladomyces subterraneus]|uniref:Porphobilinogen deaminase n=1 Tax=Polycladomyces subterraneus TaxID=1016997 RepID=A0ABT8IIV2_9BACL|nr:hydroxymethylbilane synthase [Polycladomyces subterraneus]MDN4592675.1 hydroxymethylbilane synthase [Polycladomyces subterraneus]